MMMTMDMETTAELTENESITPEAPIQQQQQPAKTTADVGVIFR